jgi:hypothetical protein
LTAGATLVPRNPARRASWRDAAGVLTIIGVGVTLLIEPDQMVRLVTLSDQPEYPIGSTAGSNPHLLKQVRPGPGPSGSSPEL